MLPDDASLPPLNNGDRPSRLALARHATGETHLDGVADPRYLLALEFERTRIEPFDFEVLRARAERLVDRPTGAGSPTPGGSSPWRWLRMFAVAMIAAGLAFALLPPPDRALPVEDGLKGPPAGGVGIERPPTIPDAGERAAAQGGIPSAASDLDRALLTYVVRRGDKQLRGSKSMVLQPGDLLGFRTFAADYEQVTLIVVNPDGTIGPLDTERGIAPVAIHAGERAMLDFHVAVNPPIPPVVAAFFGEWTEARIRDTVKVVWSSGGVSALDRLAADANDIEVLSLRSE